MSTELKSLPVATVRLIGSSQVITSVFSVVKEILENSLDAEATSVEIKLENYGLDKIEVRDNGVGIKQCNIPLVTKRYHTSKITSFSDLDSLVTYGFRGEALGSLCAVSSLSITSKTADEDVSHCVSFDCHGNVTSEVPSHLGQGTTISASHLFKNMPVRRQFYNTAKKKKEELKKVEDLLMWYGAIRPGTRLSLRHGKDLIWQKNVVGDVRSALLGVLGRSVVSQLELKKMKTDNPEVTIEAHLPRSNSDVQITSRSTSDRSFIAVNDRPVYLKDLDKCIRQHYCQHHRCESRHPVYFLSINCPSSQLDVNVDPNKTRVMLHHQKDIIAILRECLEGLYGPLIKVIQAECDGDMTMNGSVTASGDHSELLSEESDESFVQHQTVSSKAGTEQNKLKKQFNKDYHSTNKLSKQSEGKGDEDSSSGDVAGFRISFYDHNKNETDDDGNDNNDKTTGLDQNENEREKPYEILTDHNKNKTDGDGIELNDKTNGLDQNENEREKASEILAESAIINGESDDVGLTQVVGKGCFDLVDDFDSLLASQEINITKDITKDSKETDCSLMTNDLVKDSHEIEKDIVDKSNNEANGIDSGTVSRTNIQSTVWSKGQIERQTDGQTLEPVALLVPGKEGSNKRPPSPTADLEFHALTPPSKKRLSLNVQVDQPRIYDCVINSGSDNYSSGFVAFSKQIRPKVVEDNPSASYDTITRLVQEKWSALSDTNKQHFCMLGKEEIENLKKTVVEKKKLIQKIKPKPAAQVKPSLPSIKEQLLAGNRPKGDNKAQIKTVKVNFSLTKLKQTYNTWIRESQTQLLPDLRLIGPLKFYNGWLCCHGNKIQVLNPHRVEETLLHRELLDKHVLPVTKLDNPVRLTESNVGGADLFCTLLALFPSTSEAQTYTIATDERLLANGIQVRRHYNQDNEAVLDLMGLSQVMPMFGLADLAEILDLVRHTGATNLSMSRPLKVINYLQSEAVRMVRQRPLQRSRDDILDLVDQMMNSLPNNLAHCLHNKPFLHDLFDMKDAPSFPSL